MAFPATTWCLLALFYLSMLSSGVGAVPDCTLNCQDLSSNDTTSRRDRCALWYTLQRLQLEVELWIQQLPCEMYVEQSNETFHEDFIIGDNYVSGLNLSGRVQSGALAPQLAHFVQLTDFSCATCNLSGTIPASWKTWEHIQQLDLSNNNLSGPLPAPWYISRRVADKPMLLNFSSNPHLNGSSLPYISAISPPPAVMDINATALHQPMDLSVLEWYCMRQKGLFTSREPAAGQGVHVQVMNGTRDLCAPLNFRSQVGWAWVLFIVLCLGSIVTMMLAGHDSRDLPFDEFTRGQIEDLEVSYLPLPSSALSGHAGVATRPYYDDEEEEFDDHDPLPIGPPRFSKLSMLLLVTLAGVQMALDAPHVLDPWEGRRRTAWVLVLVVPHVACATVLHAAMFQHQQGWVKVVLAYFSIPLVMINMPVTWVLGVLRETINVPHNFCWSSVQVCIGIVLLPLVLIPVPTILLLLILMIIGWPEMDYAAFGRNASRVFKQLKANSYTYTMMLHWMVALVQAPLSALLVTFFYAFWFDETVFFSESRRRWLTAEFVMSLTNIWAHLLVLVRMPNSKSGDLLKRVHRRLLAAQLDIDPVLPPSHPIIPPFSDEPSNPLLSGEEATTRGVLQPPELPPRKDGIALSMPGVDAEKEMILGVHGGTPAGGVSGGAPGSRGKEVAQSSSLSGGNEAGVLLQEIQENGESSGTVGASSS